MEKYIVKEQFHLASIRNIVRKGSTIEIDGDVVRIISGESNFTTEYLKANLTELSVLKQMPKFMEVYSSKLAKECKPEVKSTSKQENNLNLEIINSDVDAHPIVNLTIKEEQESNKPKKQVNANALNELKVEVMETAQVTSIHGIKDVIEVAQAVDASTVNDKTKILTKVVEEKDIPTSPLEFAKNNVKPVVKQSAINKVDELGNEISNDVAIDVGNQAYVKKPLKKKVNFDIN